MIDRPALTLLTALAAGLTSLLASLPAAANSAQTYESTQHDFTLTTVADGFDIPWAITWLPNGDMLVTERAGRLRVVRDGRLLPEPVAGVPEVHAVGQGGLFDVLPHPRFERNRLLYLCFAAPMPPGNSGTTIVRGRFEDDRLSDVETIFQADTSGRDGHYGGRMAFDQDGYLFLTIGDRQATPAGDLPDHPAQDNSNHAGVIIRLRDDGRVPTDNPFHDLAGSKPEIWSYGHRNPQGLAFHPQTGMLWSNEHGPQGGDELNIVERGKNYGWPVIGYGVNYGPGRPIHAAQRSAGMELPRHYWVPSIATSGLMIYDGDMFPNWRGDVFSGALRGRQISRIDLAEDGREILVEETLLQGVGRIRDIRQGPDDAIYIATENRGVLRLAAAPAAEY